MAPLPWSSMTWLGIAFQLTWPAHSLRFFTLHDLATEESFWGLKLILLTLPGAEHQPWYSPVSV